MDTGNVIKSSNRKLFDDTIDSGISESSVTSEVFREKQEPGPSRHQHVIKQERESSVESSSRKRKASTDSSSASTSMAPAAKRIKAEPVSTDDELDFLFGKSEFKSNSREIVKTPVSSKKNQDKSPVKKSPSNKSLLKEEKLSSSTEKKSKKKKN